MDNYLVLFKNYNISILIDMVILHWLGLAEYSKNNIHKCVSAYYYGIYFDPIIWKENHIQKDI